MSIETSYNHKNIQVIPITAFDVLTLKSAFNSLLVIPKTVYSIYKTMLWTDHIHLRCPGNIGLIGCFVQILFPGKLKTAKYAGNWDPKAKQPWSYRLQKWLLSNTFLTKNMKVLVYGEWPNQTKNIVPFFTASYSEKEIVPIPLKNLKKTLHFLFVGTLSNGKQPLLSVKAVHKLKEKGYNVQLQIYGDGIERHRIAKYITNNNLDDTVFLHGNVSKEIIKKAYQNSHFILFFSKSEGWPKVVPEAMFWACLPITSNVSCIPFMLNNGNRGEIVNPNVNEIVDVVINYIDNELKYHDHVKKAMEWSKKYTLNLFEKEIKKLMIK